jgi:hypothetical protein
MAGGPLVAAAAQTTTTTTGTGALTIANTVPAGAPAGSTTFAAVFAPTAVFPVPNIFYVIQDAQSPNNYEVGYGTLTSATVLTRDFVIFSGTANAVAPYVPQFNQNPTASFLALSAGTANVYSNPALLSAFTPYQARFPNFTGNSTAGQDGGLTEDIMAGSFAGTLTDGTGTAAITVKYKVSSNGTVNLQIPAATTGATAGTSMSITGVPAFLCGATVAAAASGPVFGSASGAITVPAVALVTPGATAQATGSVVFQQYSVVATGFTAAFTGGVAKGFSTAIEVTYGLI